MSRAALPQVFQQEIERPGPAASGALPLRDLVQLAWQGDGGELFSEKGIASCQALRASMSNAEEAARKRAMKEESERWKIQSDSEGKLWRGGKMGRWVGEGDCREVGEERFDGRVASDGRQQCYSSMAALADVAVV